MKRCLIPLMASAILLSGCHRKKVVVIPPAPPPAQPRTAAPKQSVQRKPARTREPAAAQVKPPEQQPKLVDFITDEQRQQYDRDINADLRTAEENLAAFRSNALPNSPKQKEADRVESLVRQCRQNREAGDVTTARRLATMAKVVSDTLIR